ncbi:unnamed protein product [Moneuplotes crassus]|uniref:Uncharacterized protein n=2 Tax=Euplotes crassus TaxID=5936 RepID=A0AAD1UJW2_EUPCR|nr:unnamed protein product [Moneuplotes crassus]
MSGSQKSIFQIADLKGESKQSTGRGRASIILPNPDNFNTTGNNKEDKRDWERLDELIITFGRLVPNIRDPLPYSRELNFEGRMLKLDLSEIKFGKKREHVNKLCNFLGGCCKLQELRLNNCHINRAKWFNKIVKSVKELYYLHVLEMEQDWTEDQVTIFMGNFKYLLMNFKKIISVHKFKFLKEEYQQEYSEELMDLKDELHLNKDIVITYKGNELLNCTKVSVKHSKVCMRMFKIISFNIIITDKDWESLIEVLSCKDNKVFGLDFSKPDLKIYFRRFLEVMRKDYLYLYIDLINFGKVSISTRKLIKLANFLLIYYSDCDNPMPSSMYQYVLKCNDNYQTSRILSLKKQQIRKSMKTEEDEAKVEGAKTVNTSDTNHTNSRKAHRPDKNLGQTQPFIDLENQDPEEEEEQRVLRIQMKLRRNLTEFDYKILYAIHEQCSVKMDIDIIEGHFKEPELFNPNILLSEIRGVVRAMDYYMEPEDQRFINFRLMILFAYINFFTILFVCITIPPTFKDACGQGIKWNAHYIMWVLLFISILAEIFLFYWAIPKDILLKILKEAIGDQKETANSKITTFLAIVINSWFFVSGVIAKADLYTDVAFALEARDCGYPKIALLSFFFFGVSISYNIYSFVKLFFYIHSKNSAYPVSEQTARLLLCGEFRCLALVMERFSLTYYTKFFGIKVHIPKLLAFLKCFTEDLPQFWIQLYYIISEEGTKSVTVYVSIFFSSCSLVISFIAFLIATTSILSNEKLEYIKNQGIVRNIHVEDPNKSNESKDPQTKRNKEKQEIQETQNRISKIENMPTDNKTQRMKRAKLWFKALVELEEKNEEEEYSMPSMSDSLKSIQEELHEASESWDMTLNMSRKCQTKFAHTPSFWKKRKGNKDKKKEEQKLNQSAKFAIKALSETKDTKEASKNQLKSAPSQAESQKSNPPERKPRDANKTWFGRLKNGMKRSNEVKPEEIKTKQPEDPNLASNGIDTLGRMEESKFKNSDAVSGINMLPTQENFYNSKRNEVRISFDFKTYERMNTHEKQNDLPGAINDTIQSSDSLFKRETPTHRDEAEEKEERSASPPKDANS